MTDPSWVEANKGGETTFSIVKEYISSEMSVCNEGKTAMADVSREVPRGDNFPGHENSSNVYAWWTWEKTEVDFLKFALSTMTKGSGHKSTIRKRCYETPRNSHPKVSGAPCRALPDFGNR